MSGPLRDRNHVTGHQAREMGPPSDHVTGECDGRHLYSSAVSRRPPPDIFVVCGVVWLLLDRNEVPTVPTIASLCGRSPRQLQRQWRRSGRESLRTVITYARLSYAWRLIAEGTKAQAAIKLAGYQSRWNFNRQSRRFGGRRACEYRTGGQTQLGSVDVRRVALEFLESAAAASELGATRSF